MDGVGEVRGSGHGGARPVEERFDERFTGGLDPTVWTDSYLPAWSSREQARATWTVEDDGLHLRLPPEHPVWCPDLHHPPLRVSAVQSGNASGPVGSTRGQQPFRRGLRVREEQPPTWGFTPSGGRVEVECRAVLGPGSMFSAWMVGLEDVPERSGEICLVEVFGRSVRVDGGQAYADVGSGVHPFRDPALGEDFVAPTTAIDVAAFHTYAVDWSPGRLVFSVDDATTRVVEQAPGYPVLLILGIFDFPDEGPDPTLVPELVVRRVSGQPGRVQRS